MNITEYIQSNLLNLLDRNLSKSQIQYNESGHIEQCFYKDGVFIGSIELQNNGVISDPNSTLVTRDELLDHLKELVHIKHLRTPDGDSVWIFSNTIRFIYLLPYSFIDGLDIEWINCGRCHYKHYNIED